MNKEERKKSIYKRAVLYTVITITTVIITLLLGFYTFGFRLDPSLGKIERTGLVQFGSSPSGAISAVDGKAVQFRTPNKTVVSAGSHNFSMERNNYHPWHKTLNIKAGMLRWLNYAILVPKQMETQAMMDFETVASTLVAPENKEIALLPNEALPSVTILDIRANDIKAKTLDIAPDVYSDSGVEGVDHRFHMVEWDVGGRYLLIKHYFNDRYEWIVVDTQDVLRTKNLSTHFDIPISQIKFIDTGGNKFFVLSGSDIRRLDYNGSTISHPMVTNVSSFITYNKDYLVYIGQEEVDTQVRQVVGTLRDGDKGGTVVKSFTGSNQEIKIAATRYFNEDYIAIYSGKLLQLLKGNFPTEGGLTDNLKAVMSLSIDQPVANMTFGESGQYLMLQHEGSFLSYDLEYQDVHKFNLHASSGAFNYGWLNSTHLWSNSNGVISIHEFDGQNTHRIARASSAFTPVYTNNKKYIYSFKQVDGKVVLQRSLMILR